MFNQVQKLLFDARGFNADSRFAKIMLALFGHSGSEMKEVMQNSHQVCGCRITAHRLSVQKNTFPS